MAKSMTVDAITARLLMTIIANEEAAILGLPIPYPSPPSVPSLRDDDPCDDWGEAEPDDE